MTLKELLDRFDFKDVASFIVKYYPKQSQTMSRYKQSFDILRHLEPDAHASNEKIEVVFNCVGDGFYKRVHNCGGDFWKKNLTKEIAVSSDIALTDSEIAALCLWELTFYGFDQNTPETRAKNKERIEGEIDNSNPYTVAADKLSRKLTDNYLPKQYKEVYLPHGVFMENLKSAKNNCKKQAKPC
jgi:hypothetical protein